MSNDSRWPPPRRLARAGVHRIAWRDLGPADAPVWLAIHGGPGGASQPELLRLFNLRRQRVIAPDQRGAGDSLPRGCIRRNNMQQLVSDLEALREHLGITRWSVLAGSWGCVVALAYARAFPGRVERLVLRGAFRCTTREIGALLLPSARKGKRIVGGDRWTVHGGQPLSDVLKKCAQVFQNRANATQARRLARGWALRETRDALYGMWRTALHAQQDDAVTTRAAWRRMHRQWRRALVQPASNVTRQDRRLLARYRVQAHYLRHHGFIAAQSLDAAVHALAALAVPVDWVHGRFDAICPPANSWRWAAIGARTTRTARLHRPASGHLAGEPAMLACLRYCIGS